MYCLLSSLSLHKLLLVVFSFTFLGAVDEMAIPLGKLSPDDSPLGEPEGMLLKIYSISDSALNAFDVSSMTMNSGF